MGLAASRNLVPLFASLVIGSLLIAGGAGSPDSPLFVEVQVDAREATVVDEITLTIETRAPADWTVENPFESLEPGDELGGLTVRRVEPDETSLGAGGEIQRTIRLVLEPYLPGEETIPAMTFTARRIDGVESTTAASPPITIHVRSLLPEESSTSFEPGRIREPLDPAAATEGAGVWPIVLLTTCASIIAIIVGLLVRVSSRNPRRALRARFRAWRSALLDAPAVPQRTGLRVQRSVLREALTEVLGSAARGATMAELEGLLAREMSLQEGERAIILDFFRRADEALFPDGGGNGVLHQDDLRRPDAVLSAIERGAQRRLQSTGRLPS